MVAPPPTAAPSTAPINGFLKFIKASIQVSAELIETLQLVLKIVFYLYYTQAQLHNNL